ncbi:MAG: hypothetical protein KDJ35_05235 [Alphaproteobacteria bacterium]|nr:hypothetical protein [Alphaproteobacteria bacterium]
MDKKELLAKKLSLEHEMKHNPAYKKDPKVHYIGFSEAWFLETLKRLARPLTSQEKSDLNITVLKAYEDLEKRAVDSQSMISLSSRYSRAAIECRLEQCSSPFKRTIIKTFKNVSEGQYMTFEKNVYGLPISKHQMRAALEK